MDNNEKTSIRKTVLEMSRNWKGSSDIHKQTLKALIGVFSDLTYIDDENKVVPVKCIYGGPERVVAKINQENNIILPIISIKSNVRGHNQERRKFSPVLHSQTYWSHAHQRAVRVVSLAPKAIDLNYEVNVWSRYVSDLNQLTAQCREIFNPALTLETPLNNQTQVFLDGEANSSQSVLGDGDGRLLARKLSIRVETYIPTPIFMITSTGKIEEIVGELEIRK